MASLVRQRAKVRVVWFKNTDLRIHDHLPLANAHRQAKLDGCAVLHLVTIDTTWFSSAARSREAHLSRCGYLRAKFLLESVDDLELSLLRLGHPLLAFYGNSRDAFDTLSNVYDIVAVHAHGPELCSEEKKVENEVRNVISPASMCLEWGWTLHHIDDLPKRMERGHKIPGRYKPFLQALQRGKRSVCARPALAAPSGNDLCMTWLDLTPLTSAASTFSVGKWSKPTIRDVTCAEDLSESSSLGRQMGGESSGLACMANYIWCEDRLGKYVGSSDSMSPGKYNPLNSTTGLSAYLAHGCVSPRLLYDEVQRYEKIRVRNRSTYWVFHELVFRDYFAYSCVKWGISMFSMNGPLNSNGHPWRKNDEKARKLFKRWREGRVGYPFVDAGMRQLKNEGKMPHLLRQICTAFLVRDLRVDWRWGAEYFEACLVDYTPDANWGNWGYRILPIQQLLPLEATHITSLEALSWPVIHDPHLDYILKWVPELRPLAEAGDPVIVREPWRLAKHYKRLNRIEIKPRRDSPLWVMSVNRNNWPDYEKMMTGYAWTLSFEESSEDVIHGVKCPSYPPPAVPPLELEILYDLIPIDHSWGDGHPDPRSMSNSNKRHNATKPANRRRRKQKHRGRKRIQKSS